MNKILFFLFISSLLLSCAPKKEVNKPSTDVDSKPKECNTLGTVKNFTGLDGCKFLIILDNEKKLLPAEITDKSFVMRDGMRVKFSYTHLKDALSACMAEDMIVRIDCIEGSDEKKPVRDCVAMNNPQKVPWMYKIIKKVKPDAVIRYTYRSQDAYFFLTTRCCDHQNFLYDCRGNQICIDGGIKGGDCKDALKSLTNEKIIWGSVDGDN